MKSKFSPTSFDIIWTAGFYEGEGCCSFSHSAIVVIRQKQKWPLRHIQQLFGGSLKHYSNETSLNMFQHNRKIWTWTICGPRARGFVMTIYKFLSPRRQKQIRKVLSK